MELLSFEELPDWRDKKGLWYNPASLKGEVWKKAYYPGRPLENSRNTYLVSNYGRVKRIYKSKETILSPCYNAQSYLNVSFNIGYKKKNRLFLVHRLVAFSFSDNISNVSDLVDHINTIRCDNRLENLRIVDQKGNMANINSRLRATKIINRKRHTHKKHIIEIDKNALPTDRIEDIVPNESPRWFTDVPFYREVWKNVTEDCLVSNYGRIKKCSHRGKNRNMYIPKFSDKRYFEVCIPSQGNKRIHKLVALNFCDIPENANISNMTIDGQRLVVDHIDGNTHNNVYTNLRWCSQKTNVNNKNTLYKSTQQKIYGKLNNKIILMYNAFDGKFIKEISIEELSTTTYMSLLHINDYIEKEKIFQEKYFLYYKQSDNYDLTIEPGDFMSMMPIAVYDEYGNFLNRYDNVFSYVPGCDADAQRKRKRIYQCLKNKRHYGDDGFQYKIYEGKESENNIEPIYRNIHHNINIYFAHNGEFLMHFINAKTCSLFFKNDVKSITNVCNGSTSNLLGLFQASYADGKDERNIINIKNDIDLEPFNNIRISVYNKNGQLISLYHSHYDISNEYEVSINDIMRSSLGLDDFKPVKGKYYFRYTNVNPLENIFDTLKDSIYNGPLIKKFSFSKKKRNINL